MAEAGARLTLDSRPDFNALVKEYSKRVFNLAYRIVGDRMDAEDVVQETFLNVFRGLPDFRGESRLSTWIYRIALNNSLKTKRRLDAAYLDSLDERIEAFRHDIPAEVQEWFDQPDKRCLLQELLTEINRLCVSYMTFRLTDAQRAAYVMRYVLDYSLGEIAAVLEVSENVVKARLHRARKNLNTYFSKRCQWFDRNNPCTCSSRIGFALALRPELLQRIRMKAPKTATDRMYADYVRRQVRDVVEMCGDFPELEYKTETLLGYLQALQSKE